MASPQGPSLALLAPRPGEVRRGQSVQKPWTPMTSLPSEAPFLLPLCALSVVCCSHSSSGQPGTASQELPEPGKGPAVFGFQAVPKLVPSLPACGKGAVLKGKCEETGESSGEHTSSA